MLTQYKKYFFPFIWAFWFLFLNTNSPVAEPIIGKVTSIHADVIEMDIGSERGLRVGDTGRVYYTVSIAGVVKFIYLAKVKIISISGISSKARILEKTGEVKVGHLIEVIKEGGELEVKFDPPGAEVYLNSNVIGKTPLVFSGISPGKHLVRIVKFGYYPYEIEVEIKGEERKTLEGSLAKEAKEGYLVIRTEFEETQIFLNEKPFELKLLKDGVTLTQGEYRIRVEKDGYKAWETDVIVKAGEITEVKVHSREIQPEIIKETQVPKCPIFINTHPEGAKIYVNGKHYGLSPKHVELTVGEHSIVFIKDYYEPVARKVIVHEGQTVLPPIDQNLIPLKKIK